MQAYEQRPDRNSQFDDLLHLVLREPAIKPIIIRFVSPLQKLQVSGNSALPISQLTFEEIERDRFVNSVKDYYVEADFSDFSKLQNLFNLIEFESDFKIKIKTSIANNTNPDFPNLNREEPPVNLNMFRKLQMLTFHRNLMIELSSILLKQNQPEFSDNLINLINNDSDGINQIVAISFVRAGEIPEKLQLLAMQNILLKQSSANTFFAFLSILIKSSSIAEQDLAKLFKISDIEFLIDQEFNINILSGYRNFMLEIARKDQVLTHRVINDLFDNFEELDESEKVLLLEIATKVNYQPESKSLNLLRLEGLLDSESERLQYYGICLMIQIQNLTEKVANKFMEIAKSGGPNMVVAYMALTFLDQASINDFILARWFELKEEYPKMFGPDLAITDERIDSSSIKIHLLERQMRQEENENENKLQALLAVISRLASKNSKMLEQYKLIINNKSVLLRFYLLQYLDPHPNFEILSPLFSRLIETSNLDDLKVIANHFTSHGGEEGIRFLQKVIEDNDNLLIYDQSLEYNKEKKQHLIDINYIFDSKISHFREHGVAGN